MKDGCSFLGYEDDATCKLVAFGIFKRATSANALAVLDEAIKTHGKPASIMTDHDIQFFASESETYRRGRTRFEKRLASHGIRHVLARVGHPQTNGKIERFTRRSSAAWLVRGSVGRRVDPLRPRRGRHACRGPLPRGRAHGRHGELVKWYNEDRPHMSLDEDAAPAEAYVCKMPLGGKE